MPLQTLTVLLIAALITAGISGIFGMAGGMIFMGVLATYLGVAEAMVVHGAVQGVSNSYRGWLIRDNIRWDIIGRIALGVIPALALLAFAAYVPSKGVLFLALGLLPGLLWLPYDKFSFDAQKPAHAILCGFVITGLNLVAGVAGPAFDMFFVRTDMPRHEIVATKAITMFGSHMMKIVYFGIPILIASDLSGLPPLWFFLAVIPLIMIGTFAGTRILKRMSDVGFRKYTKWLVSVVGLIYLWRGAGLLGWI
ncbi:MAG: sulfite exporter TauE/SafE family protein [Hyphomonadaceae bacterium]|nr:sulfite exporter TauE/SafE family protein [Hyphomonadaceae bacterium]